ncbi:MAG: caspase family protein [Candidatus Bathyarchaeota archaeon]|nr:MAG: caspase family protein [Candidatus Bathyarchaeota archaeon]
MPNVMPKRRAVVVGVQKYKELPELEGAENDAWDIYKRLKDPRIGSFTIPKKHFLIGDKATHKQILQAISDVFYDTGRSCDLALFYFSGHGVEVEWYNEGYIAPCDMSMKHPFVSGIRMSELTRVISKSVESGHVKCAMTILDCCYSGIATKGSKATFDPGKKYDEHIKDFSSREGMIILASSGEDQQSREMPECVHKHGDEKEAHAHGAFTFCLIEGLDGEAADPDGSGIIYLDRLKEVVRSKLEVMGKQNARGLFAGELGNLMIAKCPTIYEENIQQNMNAAEKAFKKNKPVFLFQAVDRIANVLEINPKHKKALDFKREIDATLMTYQDKGTSWLTDNMLYISPELIYVYPKLEDLVDNFPDFDRITKLDDTTKKLFVYLCRASKGDMSRKKFIRMCKPFENPSSSSALKKDTPTSEVRAHL